MLELRAWGSRGAVRIPVPTNHHAPAVTRSRANRQSSAILAWIDGCQLFLWWGADKDDRTVNPK